MADATDKLLPCPFCGGEAEIHPSNDWDAKFTGSTYFAWCDKCETRGDYYNTEAEAIEAWNTRAERTGWLTFKRGAMYDVAHYSCCGYEYAESVSEDAVAENYCPNCGRSVVE